MVRDPTRRVAKYSVKIDHEVIKQRFEGQRTAMVDQVTDVFASLADLEDRAKTILDYEAVATIDIPFYLAFVRQCYRLQRTHAATTAQTEASYFKSVWVSRGLASAILSRLAADLFGWTI